MCGFVGPVENLWAISIVTVKNTVHRIHTHITAGAALSSTSGNVTAVEPKQRTEESKWGA